jgi:hypothetical protein
MISRRIFISKTMIGSIDIVFPNFKFTDSKIIIFKTKQTKLWILKAFRKLKIIYI